MPWTHWDLPRGVVTWNMENLWIRGKELAAQWSLMWKFHDVERVDLSSMGLPGVLGVECTQSACHSP